MKKQTKGLLAKITCGILFVSFIFTSLPVSAGYIETEYCDSIIIQPFDDRPDKGGEGRN